MQYVATPIQEAWEHRRRRIRAFGIAGLAAVLIAALIMALSSHGSGSTAGTPRPSTAVVKSSVVLSKSPYLGVSCPVANSIACDRVGLAVWLKQPAVSVTATIDGTRLRLNRYGDAAGNVPIPRRQFSGFLQPAGIVSRLHIRSVDGNVITMRHGHTHVTVAHQMWFGEGNALSPLIGLTIHTTTGKPLVTHLRVGLATGWG